MMQELVNPKTDEYLTFKKEIFSSNFSWYWNEDSVTDINGKSHEDAIPFFNHTIIKRPFLDSQDYSLYPKQNSVYTDITNIVLKQIFQYNKINLNCLLRASLNLTIPLHDIKHTRPHVDHVFPHKNLLVYLNDSDGDTVLCDDNNNDINFSSPKEDKIIFFEGKHYHYLPSKFVKRIILVCTFI